MNKHLLISVIIPTYNPESNRLQKTLHGLKEQSLNSDRWELIIIDNNSNNQFERNINLSWHPNTKIIRESKQGLTFARIAGLQSAQSPLIILVDDDNVLYPSYLEKAIAFMESNSSVGSVGGKSLAYFEDGYQPAAWSLDFLPMVAVRDLGNEQIISEPGLKSYPACAPIGAGLVLRRDLMKSYIDYIQSSDSIITDRNGSSLASGGDNEVNIFILKQGFSVAYDPELTLQHIIPAGRLTVDYLSRLNYQSSKSWIILLQKHGISPFKRIPKWTVPLRQLKSLFSIKPWRSPSSYIHWKGLCGTYRGQAES